MSERAGANLPLYHFYGFFFKSRSLKKYRQASLTSSIITMNGHKILATFLWLSLVRPLFYAERGCVSGGRIVARGTIEFMGFFSARKMLVSGAKRPFLAIKLRIAETISELWLVII